MALAAVKSIKVEDLLQNKKALAIGGGVLLLLIVVVVAGVLMMNRGSSTASSGVPPINELPAAMPGGSASTVGPGGVDPTMQGTNAGGTPQPGGDSAIGDSTGVGAAGAAPAAGPEKDLPPGVPGRKNPFSATKEVSDILRTIDPYKPPADIGPQHGLYDDLNPRAKQKKIDSDENDGPAVPPMRLLGVVLGAQISGLLQMGSEYIPIRPGMMIPEGRPTYRVERIESDKVLLVNRWEIGDRKGTQRIEVPLAPMTPAPTFQPGSGMMPGGGGPGFNPGGGTGNTMGGGARGGRGLN